MESYFTGVAEPWLWIGFSVAVVVLLVLDLTVIHRRDHAVKIAEALRVSAFWILLSLAFNAWFAWRYGSEIGVQFLTGYLIEKSLSIDNLFVILLIFSALNIPAKYQHRVLFWGVLGAILMRGTLVIIGAKLIASFHWIIYIFGAILLVTAVRLLRSSDEKVDFSDHWAIRLLRRRFPITNVFQGHQFIAVIDGVRHATPLLVALVLIEATDLVFAVDSIPAVFAVTNDPFVAFSSNVLALLGLRALYFVIADWVSKFRYLKPGLSGVLAFVGVKMIGSDFFTIPSWISLLVIAFILGVALLASWHVDRKHDNH